MSGSENFRFRPFGRLMSPSQIRTAMDHRYRTSDLDRGLAQSLYVWDGDLHVHHANLLLVSRPYRGGAFGGGLNPETALANVQADGASSADST